MLKKGITFDFLFADLLTGNDDGEAA